MPRWSMYTPHELEILRPLGGPVFVDRAVKAILTAVKAAVSDCRANYIDVVSSDVVGNNCRAKINEAIVGLAAACGLELTIEKRRRQRYHCPVIRAGGTVLTVARMYGPNNVTRPSGLRCDLAQMRLFDSDAAAYDDDVRALILAYLLVPEGDQHVVKRIELQEIGTSPEDVTFRIDLLARAAVQSVSVQEVVFDDFDIKPKEGLLRKHG